MKRLTIGEAAKLTGKSKSTISRAIKSGRISASTDKSGFQIDVSELTRVFPATVAQPHQSNDPQPHEEHQHARADALEIENKMLREMLDRERDTVDDLRTRLTQSESRFQALLTDKTDKPRKKWWHIR